MTTLGTNQQLNQFTQTAVRGSLDQLYNFNIIPALIKNENANQKTSAGDMVVFTAGANGVPVVREVLATDTDETLANTMKGFVVRNLKQNAIDTNDEYTRGIACEGSVMRMIAEQPIESGEQIFYDAREAATAGSMVFSNLDVENFKSISAGTLNLLIDDEAVNLTSLDFSSATTLANVATILSNAITSAKGTATAVNDKIFITSATQGVNSSVAIAEGGLTSNVAVALKASTAQTVDGQAAGENTGKILSNVSNEDGVLKCGYALDTAVQAGDLIRVYIKF